MGTLDLPSEPEEAGRAEHSGKSGADRLPTRELPDPEERGRAYDAARAYVSAETMEEASPGQRTEGNDRRSYWDEVPRFFDSWAEHQKKWPTDRQPAVDRSADPPGSYRSDGGFYLNPERHAEAVAAIGRARDAEPRISADLKSTEQGNTYGGWLESFKDRHKGEDRLKEKVAERLAGEPDKAPTEILRNVPDVIRYTFCLRPESYSRGYYDIKERLEGCGYQAYESRNSWDGAEYKGITPGG